MNNISQKYQYFYFYLIAFKTRFAFVYFNAWLAHCVMSMRRLEQSWFRNVDYSLLSLE